MCLFNIFCDDKFEQSEADRRVFCKFDDGEVEMVVGTYARGRHPCSRSSDDGEVCRELGEILK